MYDKTNCNLNPMSKTMSDMITDSRLFTYDACNVKADSVKLKILKEEECSLEHHITAFNKLIKATDNFKDAMDDKEKFKQIAREYIIREFESYREYQLREEKEYESPHVLKNYIQCVNEGRESGVSMGKNKQIHNDFSPSM